MALLVIQLPEGIFTAGHVLVFYAYSGQIVQIMWFLSQLLKARGGLLQQSAQLPQINNIGLNMSCYVYGSCLLPQYQSGFSMVL